MVKEHYNKHLGNFYSWMVGDFEVRKAEQFNFFRNANIQPFTAAKIAIDLGAAHGLQAIPLANLGFQVRAIDFNRQLLSELAVNKKQLPIEIIEEDIREVKKYAHLQPELITCCGDTITHLSGTDEIIQLIKDCANILVKNGKLVLSFRDYSTELTDNQRIIPVKSDNNRILTAFLEYFPQSVRVTDLLYERQHDTWIQQVSSYFKTRISADTIVCILQECKLNILFNQPINKLITIVAQKND
jgi:2-polyprenyl-3-methyl-5-hydroxy-6-metoxy-1,4-benzoquinol methylase